jgi:TonB family protein
LGVEAAELWNSWEGRVIDGQYSLLRYLGGRENGAVFLTGHGGGKAAVKLIRADPQRAKSQLARWRLASSLSHPNLIRIFAVGQCRVQDTGLIYLVMEYADENLSQVLPERALTAEETREMLEPAVEAIAYLHREGFVHGHLKPSNIMAVEEQVRLSSDGICRIGESTATPGDDVWAVGLTIVEVLTQRREALVPDGLPEPFRDLARHCLQPDAAKRWTVTDVSRRLRGAAPKWRYIVAAAVVCVAALSIWLLRDRLPTHNEPVRMVQAVQQKAAPPEPLPVRPPDVPKAPVRQPKREVRVSQVTHAGIVREVLPEISQKARNTIHGKPVVSVRVRVNPAGDVAEAKFESKPVSRFLGEAALRAARAWKFEPGDANQEWILRFDIYRTETKVFPSRVIASR